ncbi:hypothetical protein FB192DRAFT_1440350 [Mucor lusitanicus]|uniref:C2H2-type domain-containing protein n=1 Tax=Mucor circinelloides f. lusitanicus TaxID=29924 RepID=A0A8H4EX57_MUCCL|nr:hypothetical protein FB192DRAFT_1440350 [Mucor lusitanicus]
MSFVCTKYPPCAQAFSSDSLRKTHVRCVHQALVDVKYPGGHVEKDVARNPIDGTFSCRICNNYKNINPSLLKRQANNCQAFRSRISVPAAAGATVVPETTNAPITPIAPSVPVPEPTPSVPETTPFLADLSPSVPDPTPFVPEPTPFVPVEPHVSTAPSESTPTVPSPEPSAADMDATTDPITTDPTDPIIDDTTDPIATDPTDPITADTTEQSEPIQLDTTDYNLDYQSLGLVIHLQSKSVICINCKCAVQIENVVAHFNRNHSLTRRIAQYNQTQQQQYQANLDNELPQDLPEPLATTNLEDRLRELGAVSYNEHHLYIAPLRDPLPVISLLEVSPGFVCGYCPLRYVSAVAAFAGTRSTMLKHMRLTHRGLNHDNYTTCHVQHLYNDQGHKVYFGVERLYSGPTIESTITSEGDALFDEFLSENPGYDEGFNPDASIGDSRVFSRFYDYMHWFDLVNDVAGEDTNENRILLHNWVNARTPQFRDDIARMDADLKMLVRQYFNYMQRLMSSSSSSFYHFRIAVMQNDVNEPTPTVGLRPLNVNSRNKYFDLFFKYIKMMMMAAAPSFASSPYDDQHTKYRAFGEVIFNGTNGETTRRFVDEIQEIILDMRSSRSEFRAAEIAFPVLHTYFMALVSEEPANFHQSYKSSVLVFTAFSMISQSGVWKNVRYVKSVPARLKYMFRSIVLYQLLLDNNGLVFVDEDNFVQSGNAQDNADLDTDLTDDEMVDQDNDE